MCRAKLPEHQQGNQFINAWIEIVGRVSRGESSWTALTPEETLKVKDILALLEASANLGPNGMHNWGLVNLYGHGVEMNTELGLLWLRRAANGGEMESQRLVGGFEINRGNLKEGLRWVGLAAEQGCQKSIELIELFSIS
jgi:TPR repeat protein